MTPNSLTIYRFLFNHASPVKNADLAKILGMTEREIQGMGEDEGVLERARREIYQEHSVFLVTNFSGSILTSDPDKAEEWIAQVWARATRSFDSLQALKKRIADKRGKEDLRLAL